jgi:hypothetical protein
MSILQHLNPPGFFFLPGVQSVSYPSSLDLSDSGISEKVIFPGKFPETIGRNKKGTLIYADTDLISGCRFSPPDLMSLKNITKDTHLSLDLSISLANSDFDLEKVDSCLFSSDYVFGLKPGITVLIVKNPFFRKIWDIWGHLFYPENRTSSDDQSAIICHDEVDLLRLFAFKEMCSDLIRRDLKMIANEVVFKSILLNHALEAGKSFELLVKEEKYRSSNVISARFMGPIDRFRSFCLKKGILADEIYQDRIGHLVRFGNFPVHSKEQVAYLADCIESFD